MESRIKYLLKFGERKYIEDLPKGILAQSAMNGASKTPRKCVRTVYRCVLRCLSHIYAIEF